jgi:hypothetical protein
MASRALGRGRQPGTGGRRGVHVMKSISRQQCITELESQMQRMVDGEHSMCEIASKKGIYCKGFKQWTFEELKQRYDWIVASRPNITREELEKIANAWQIARQSVFGTSLACDTQTIEHDTCKGFDGWSDQDLARFHGELCGEPVEVLSLPATAKQSCE